MLAARKDSFAGSEVEWQSDPDTNGKPRATSRPEQCTFGPPRSLGFELTMIALEGRERRRFHFAIYRHDGCKHDVTLNAPISEILWIFDTRSASSIRLLAHLGRVVHGGVLTDKAAA